MTTQEATTRTAVTNSTRIPSRTPRHGSPPTGPPDTALRGDGAVRDVPSVQVAGGAPAPGSPPSEAGPDAPSSPTRRASSLPKTSLPKTSRSTTARPTSSLRPWKKAGCDVRRDYRLHLMVGFVLALALLWSLTFIDYRAGDDYVVQLSEQEVVEMEEVKQTAQEVAPPPPPRPTAPIEVANDAIIDDTRELNFDATLDLNAALDVGPAPSAPPPPEPEAVEEDEIFVVVEEQPVLMGGLKALQAQIQYPEMAAKAGIDGRVIVQFIVDETGRVTDAVVMRGRHRLLDQEALRVVQDARFTPGRQRGEPVKVQMALPITFVLQER